MKSIAYENEMSWQEINLLFNLLDKYIKVVPICSGKCENCHFGIESRTETDIHCPLIMARELIDYMDIYGIDFKNKMG